MDFTADFPKYGRRGGRPCGHEHARRDDRGGRRGHHGGHHGGHRGGHDWAGGFGPGFGAFGGFGGFPFGPRRRRGSRASRGDIRLAVLALLSERAMHGYQLMREIATRSDGVWRPSPGAIYPALQMLEDEGLIEPEQPEGAKRVFRLSDAGRGYVAEHREQIDAVWDAVDSDVDEDWMELANTSRQIVQAYFQVVSAGSRRQVAEATELMAETRRKLYRILSEDDTPDDTDDGGPDEPQD